MSRAIVRRASLFVLLLVGCRPSGDVRQVVECQTYQQMTAPIGTVADSAHNLYLYAKPALFDSIRTQVQESLSTLSRRADANPRDTSLVVFGRVRGKGIADPVWLRDVRLVDGAFEACVVPVPLAVAPWLPRERVRMNRSDVLDWQALTGDGLEGAFAVRAYLAALPARLRPPAAKALLGGRQLLAVVP